MKEKPTTRQIYTTSELDEIIKGKAEEGLTLDWLSYYETGKLEFHAVGRLEESRFPVSGTFQGLSSDALEAMREIEGF